MQVPICPGGCSTVVLTGSVSQRGGDEDVLGPTGWVKQQVASLQEHLGLPNLKTGP